MSPADGGSNDRTRFIRPTTSGLLVIDSMPSVTVPDEVRSQGGASAASLRTSRWQTFDRYISEYGGKEKCDG